MPAFPRSLRSALTAAALATTAAVAHASVVTAHDATAGSVDNALMTRTFAIGQHGTVTDVDLTVHFAKCGAVLAAPGACTSGLASYANEIEFTLTNPLGTALVLMPRSTFSSSAPKSGDLTFTFDDEALALVGSAFASGSYRPTTALSNFDGANAFGMWTLGVRDTNGRDPISYFDATLSIALADAPAPNGVPEPASLALAAIALVGVTGTRRCRR